MLDALALASALLALEPRRATVDFATYIDGASVICIGTVDAVKTIELPPNRFTGQPTSAVFGHVRVERVLKGPADLREFWHEGWSTMVEDSTVPGLDVRGLLLMGPPSLERLWPSDVRERVQHELGTTTILRNMGGGQGLIAIHRQDECEYVSHYAMPLALRAPGSTLPKGASRLVDVTNYVETLLRFSGEAQVIHAHRAQPGASAGAVDVPGSSFDLRVLDNGNYRLAVRVDGYDSIHETVTLGSWDEAAWKSLRAAEEQILGGTSVTLGSQETWLAPRRLRLSFGASQLAFCDAKLDPESLAGADLQAYRCALRCWDELRARIELAGVADDRAQDARWLEKH